ncbi:hypothetical protein MRY87_05670 [bacterium]|nr:hypothetical protein [bacterium]
MRYVVSLSLRSVVFVLLLLLSSCSLFSSHTDDPGTLTSLLLALEGKDPLVLSEENKHLAPNELVRLLQQESTSIRGFLQTQGIPDAIRVVNTSDRESEIDAYYLAPDERFRLERQDSVWVVVGPEGIQREYVVPLRQAVRRRMQLQDAEREKNPRTPSQRDESGVDNESSSDPFIERLNAVYGSRNDRPSPNEEDRTAQLEDLIADTSAPEARQNPRGDVLHLVVSPQEKFAHIAAWYTLEKGTAEKIARVNGRQPRAPLLPNAEIVIPSYLVKNRKQLTAQALSKLDLIVGEALKAR